MWSPVGGCACVEVESETAANTDAKHAIQLWVHSINKPFMVWSLKILQCVFVDLAVFNFNINVSVLSLQMGNIIIDIFMSY